MNAKQVGRTFATFSQRFVKILKEVTSAIVYQDLEKATLFVKVITTLLVYFWDLLSNTSTAIHAYNLIVNIFSTNFDTDIDECFELTSGCEQLCNNTPGSFECQCFPGFFLKSDKTTCSKLGLY